MTHRPNQAGHIACHSNKIYHFISFHFMVSYAVTCVYFRLKFTIGDRNLGSEMAWYEAINADCQRDYYKRRKLAGPSPGNDNEVSIIKYCTGW